jgi:hypothetical protein
VTDIPSLSPWERPGPLRGAIPDTNSGAGLRNTGCDELLERRRGHGEGEHRQWHPAQDERLQPLQPAALAGPRAEPAMAKVDGCRSTRSPPHVGQATLVEELKTMVSNSAPHSSQRYS